MARLPIITFPAKSLKKPSRPVEKVTSRITDFVKDMFETMYAGNGIGLAAPQVDEHLNIFVMDVKKPDPIDPEKLISNPVCLINPRIIRREGTVFYEEGCLSCPELLVEVERNKIITVEGLNAEGRPVKYDLTDLDAVCTQHEMDHLKGKLLTDYISRLKKDLYRKQLIRKRQDDWDQGQV